MPSEVAHSGWTFIDRDNGEVREDLGEDEGRTLHRLAEELGRAYRLQRPDGATVASSDGE